MRLLTFLAGITAGVLLKQSLSAKRATSSSVPATTDVDDSDTVRPAAGVEILGSDGAPIVAGVGVPGDGVRS